MKPAAGPRRFAALLTVTLAVLAPPVTGDGLVIAPATARETSVKE